jgi:GAF domain-containing protein
VPVGDARLRCILDRLAADGRVAESAGWSLERAVSAAAEVVGVDGAGVLLADADQRLFYVVASDGRAKALEQAQESTGEGPCVDAYVLRRAVHTPDLLADARWPALSPALGDAGVCAVLGVPIGLSGVTVGTLNLFADRRRDWDTSEVAAVEAVNRLLESQLAAAVERFRAEVLVAQLEHALSQRVTIDRATGVLMERDCLDAGGAFDALRRRARSERRRAVEVAEEILRQAEPGDSPRVSAAGE